MAYAHNFTCTNITNVEDSPITKVIDQIVSDKKKKKQEEGPVVLLDLDQSSDVSDESLDKGNQNIGLYMKSGFCYSTIKSFIPQVICLSLVGVWFSDNK